MKSKDSCQLRKRRRNLKPVVKDVPATGLAARAKRFNSKHQLTLHCLVGLDNFSWLRGVSNLSIAVI